MTREEAIVRLNQILQFGESDGEKYDEALRLAIADMEALAETDEAAKALPSPEELRQASLEARAEALFNAYNKTGPNPWKTWDGKDVPRWNQIPLNNQVRAKWIAVARASK